MESQFGLTWWGQRWIAAIEALGRVYANRLPRGRAYATDGSVTDLIVAPGLVTARVAGSRPSPYRVGVRIPVFTDAEWTAAAFALGRQVRHSAALLDGRMPEDIDETLDTVGLSLFPAARELDTSCSCPDVANPCKHVAAVHYRLAQTLDADPFLLPALRGRDRAALLAELRAARTGGRVEDHQDDLIDGATPISALSASSLFDTLEDLTAIVVRPQEAVDPLALLRRLGPPPDFASVEELGQLVAGAAARAWRLASGHGDDDPLLATLRSRGCATAAELAAALGTSTAELRSALRPLLADGMVYRTGHAKTTRYHA